MIKNDIKLNKNTAKEILTLICKWISGLFDEDGIPEKLFNLLLKYKSIFPENCFFNGTVYRKTNNINEESDPRNDIIYRMRSCSYVKGANHKELYIHFQGKYYQFTCKNGFILIEIVKFLCDLLNKNIDHLPYFGGFAYSPLDRLDQEKEVICIVSKRDLRKEIK